MGIAFEEEQVSRGEAERAEVRALSGQEHVPLLLIDGEAICDSRRIVEHLRFLVPGLEA